MSSVIIAFLIGLLCDSYGSLLVTWIAWYLTRPRPGGVLSLAGAEYYDTCGPQCQIRG